MEEGVSEHSRSAAQPPTPRGPYSAGQASVRDYTLEHQQRINRYRWAVLVALCLEVVSLFGSALFLVSFGWALNFIWPTMFAMSAIVIAVVAVCLGLSAAIVHLRPNNRIVRIAVGASLFASCMCLTQVVVALADASDREMTGFSNRWRDRVREDPTSACGFERSLQCSGWDHACVGQEARAGDCPQCNPPIVFRDACYDVVVQRVLLMLPIVCTAGTAAAVGLVAIAGLLWKLQKQLQHDYDPIDEFL